MNAHRTRNAVAAQQAAGQGRPSALRQIGIGVAVVVISAAIVGAATVLLRKDLPT